MIKVERIDKPRELTDDVQKQLTDEFKKDKKKQVWNKSYIRKELLKECHLVAMDEIAKAIRNKVPAAKLRKMKWITECIVNMHISQIRKEMNPPQI